MSDTNELAILGAGTMGAGIAQVAATAGWTVRLHDVDGETLHNAFDTVHGRFDRLVEKQRITSEECEAAKRRLFRAPTVNDLNDCTLVIEAIVEDMDIKVKALRPVIDLVEDSAIIASNTSSLSITKLGDALGIEQRFVGMHFFNPAPLMKLVEVVAGKATDPKVVDRVATIAESWGKKVARAADVPGFIVNHVARPYYLEAFRIMEDGFADAQQIDNAMKTVAGFRMGPLELTDLIGQDVNTATTRSVWEQLDRPPLLKPSAMQEQLVTDGHLGRKTGRGVYDHTGDAPTPAIEIEPHDIDWSNDLETAVRNFVSSINNAEFDRNDQYIVARIVAALIVQGHRAQQRGVATAEDIDTAMKFGVNYPSGPFEWTQAVEADSVAALLEALNATADDNRFALSQLRPEADVR